MRRTPNSTRTDTRLTDTRLVGFPGGGRRAARTAGTCGVSAGIAAWRRFPALACGRWCLRPLVVRAHHTVSSPRQEGRGSQNLAQKLPGPRVLGFREEGRGRAVLDDHAAVGEERKRTRLKSSP